MADGSSNSLQKAQLSSDAHLTWLDRARQVGAKTTKPEELTPSPRKLASTSDTRLTWLDQARQVAATVAKPEALASMIERAWEDKKNPPLFCQPS